MKIVGKKLGILVVILSLFMIMMSCNQNILRESSVESTSIAFERSATEQINSDPAVPDNPTISKAEEETPTATLDESGNTDDASQAAEDLAALCAALPYPGIKERHVSFYPIVDDDVGKELADFIARGIWLELPEYSFESPEKAPSAFVTSAAVTMTKSVNWEDSTLGIDQIFSLLRKVCPGYDYLIPYAHVEQTAQQIFGLDITVEHQNIRFYTNCPEGGAYVMNGFGLMYSVIPVLLSYHNAGDCYEAEVVYVINAYGEDENGEYAPRLHSMEEKDETIALIPPDNRSVSQEAMNFLLAQPLHYVTIKEQSDGSLVYWKHILPVKK